MTNLAQAVGEFVDVMHGVADAALERPWAWGPYEGEGVRFAHSRTYDELRELTVKIQAARIAAGCPMLWCVMHLGVTAVVTNYRRRHAKVLQDLTGAVWQTRPVEDAGYISAMRAFNQRMATEPRLTSLLVPISDGMCVGVVNP